MKTASCATLPSYLPKVIFRPTEHANAMKQNSRPTDRQKSVGYCNCVGRSASAAAAFSFLGFGGGSSIAAQSVNGVGLCLSVGASRPPPPPLVRSARSSARSIVRSSDYKSQTTDTTAECCRLREVFGRVEGASFKVGERRSVEIGGQNIWDENAAWTQVPWNQPLGLT